MVDLDKKDFDRPHPFPLVQEVYWPIFFSWSFLCHWFLNESDAEVQGIDLSADCV